MNIQKSLIFILSLFMLSYAPTASGRKTGYKLKVGKERRERKGGSVVSEEASDSTEMVSGSFMVASDCKSCNNGYALNQVVFTGFDKAQSNSKESFFIINNTDRELTAVSLYIDYRTPDGRQLTRRFIRLSCSIPPGETRSVAIPTWETQRSFYYHKSRKSGKGGNPFDIVFDPVAYYLRF